MPNTLSALPSSVYTVTNDPTQSIAGSSDPMGDLSTNPYAEMTDEFLFGAVNTLLGDIDAATGLDLLGIVTPLENLLGAEHGLLSGFVAFLTPGANQIGLAGNVLSGLFSSAGHFLTNFIPDITRTLSSDLQGTIDTIKRALGGGGLDIGNPVSAIQTALSNIPGANIVSSIAASIIPGLDASKIVSGVMSLVNLPNTILTSIGGVASSLITGLLNAANIPGLDASKITSGKFLGSLLPDITRTLSSDLQGTIDTIKSALGGGSSTGNPVSAIGTALSNIPGANVVSAISAAIIPGIDASKIISGIVSEAQTGLNTLRDAIVNGLGLSGTGTTNTQLNSQAAVVNSTASNAQAIAINAQANLAAIQAASTGAGNSGNSGGDQFNYTATSLPTAHWDSTNTGSGGVQTNGNDAFWNDSGTSGTQLSRFLDVQTATDQQIITLVMSSPVSENVIGNGQYPSYVSGCARMDSAKQNYIQMDIVRGSNGTGRSDGIYVYKIVGGAAPVLIGSFAYTYSAGDVIQLICGATTSTTRTFTLVVNGNPEPAITENSGTLSVFGSSNRWGGMFWSATPRPVNAETTPGNVAGFTIADYSPPTYVGSGARLLRGSATNVSASSAKTANTNYALPASFWDTTDKNTSDITPSLANGTFTVSKTGWYQVNCRIAIGVAPNTANASVSQICPVLYVNGSVVEVGVPSPSFFTDSSGAAYAIYGFGGSFNVYATAGQTISLGYRVQGSTPTTLNLTGGAGGLSFFEVQLANLSLN